jgi:hypothetical protein
MVGACLIAAFLVSAMAAGTASAKDPYTAETYSQYKYCPYENPEVTDCFVGRTAGGAKGGFFKYGGITVKLNKPIVLQGGGFNDENAPGASEGGSKIVQVTGGETLEAPELKVSGGLGVITKSIQEQAEWPQALRESFKEARKNHEGNVNIKIELAGGNQLFEDPNGLSTEHIINETGIAFKLPLKVRVISPWLEKLGGGPCMIGNDASPVMQNLTSEGAGTWGTALKWSKDFTNVEIQNSTLVDTGWHIEEASRPSGCGGEYESQVDEALNRVLGTNPAKTGITVLQGNLHDAGSAKVKELAEKGEL